MVIQDKKQIRKNIKELKKTYSPEQKLELSLLAQKQLENREEFLKAKNILLYYSLPDEVNTEYLIHKWGDDAANGKNIILPVVEGENLILKPYKKDEIASGYQNISEPTGNEIIDPAIIDLAIIPLVAFDSKCNRLGRGKGFYDRLLPYINCKKIGLAFDFQRVECVPTESFDKSLDAVITNQNSFEI